MLCCYSPRRKTEEQAATTVTDVRGTDDMYGILKGKHVFTQYDVYDGDTLHVIVNTPNIKCPVRVTARVAFINAPELRGGTATSRMKADDAKKKVIEVLREHSKTLCIEIIGREKYGRCLSNIYVDYPKCSRHLSNILVENHLAAVMI